MTPEVEKELKADPRWRDFDKIQPSNELAGAGKAPSPQHVEWQGYTR